MSAFYDCYVRLCALKGVSLSRAAESVGLSRTSPNGWKKGKMPSDVTLAKLANYFDCTVEDLTGETKKPTLSGEPNKEALLAVVDTMTREELIEMLNKISQRLTEV